MLSLPELRGLTGGRHGIIDVACPLCGPYARSPSNRKREVLRIWDKGDIVTFKCARCNAKGWVKDGAAKQHIPVANQSPRKKDRAETASRLWSMSQERGLHDTYLRYRKCPIASPNLRFLQASGKYPPAMIARFGVGVVTGVHLTHLRHDGLGKADVDTAKITIGPSIGQPIIIRDAPKQKVLIITEGIEDAASLALASKATVWAAGSAGRIAALMPITKDYERILVAVDQDAAGEKAFQSAKAARQDIVPITFGGYDANKMLIKHGLAELSASINTVLCSEAHS